MQIIIKKKSFKSLSRTILAALLFIQGLFLAGTEYGSYNSSIFNRREAVAIILLFSLTYGFDYLYENFKNKKMLCFSTSMLLISTLSVIVYMETALNIDFMILSSIYVVLINVLFEVIDSFCSVCKGKSSLKLILLSLTLVVIGSCIIFNSVYSISKSSALLTLACVNILFLMRNSTVRKENNIENNTKLEALD